MTKQTNNGFTLVEMLLVVALIVMILALLLPALGRTRETANRVLCQSNLRQMGNACAIYATYNTGWTPDSLRYSGRPGENGDGTRNVQHNQGPESVGKLMSQGYLAEKSGNVYCPSRLSEARYGPEAWGFGWSGWGSTAPVEYSYQHRFQRRLKSGNSGDVYGADLGIVDNYYVRNTFIGNMSCGAIVAHGDQYYNVIYFDLSGDPFIDEYKTFESALYNNQPGRVLNTIEDLD